MSAQIGTLLEFLGYWFDMPILLGMDRLVKMEDRIESVLRLFPWFGVAHVNYVAARFIYNLILEQCSGEYAWLELLVFLGPAAAVAVFSISVGIKLLMALNRLMFDYTLFSIGDILHLIGEIWSTSLKPYTVRWLYRCLAIAICIGVPVAWLVLAAVAFFTGDTSPGIDLAVFASLMLFSTYFVVMAIVLFLGVVALGYGALACITLLLKRFLIDLADNSAFHRRAVWWNVGLSVLGILLQVRAAESTTEALGLIAQILAFGLLFPGLLEQVPRDFSRKLVLVGLIVFFGGVMLQVWSPINWVGRVGLLLDAISLVIAFPVTYRFVVRVEAFGEGKDRSVLWYAFGLFTSGAALQLAGTFVP
jgi:hypothetical protein